MEVIKDSATSGLGCKSGRSVNLHGVLHTSRSRRSLETAELVKIQLTGAY